jgi:hypothetical protein
MSMALRIGELEDARIEAGASREKAAAAAEATAPASVVEKLDRLQTDVTRLVTTVRVGGGMIGAGVLAILLKVYFG